MRSFIAKRARARGPLAQAGAFAYSGASILGEVIGPYGGQRLPEGMSKQEAQAQGAANLGIISQADAKELIATLNKTNSLLSANNTATKENTREGLEVITAEERVR